MDQFTTDDNISKLYQLIVSYADKNHQITLDGSFEPIFKSIIGHICKTLTECNLDLNQLNKLCLHESIKYIKKHLSLFSAPKNKDISYNTMNGCYQNQSNKDANLDRDYQAMLERRRMDNPYMNNPTYIDPKNNAQNMGPISNMGPVSNQTPSNSRLMSMILQTPLAVQHPNLVAGLHDVITQMQPLMEMLVNNPNTLQQQLNDPKFLQMLVTRISTQNNPNMKPINLSDSPPIQTGGTGPNLVQGPNVIQGPNIPPSGDISYNPNINLMNTYIPPSEQLVNNTLPDLDQVHLIGYELALDMRTDGETETDLQYPLKFTKFGNISKIELTSCFIPINDNLMNEPYIFVKIEEINGRCYTANHNKTFGKLLLNSNNNGYLHYIPDTQSCVQYFSQPITLDRLTISFLNYQGKLLDLKEILINKVTKIKDSDKLKFVTKYKHNLNDGEMITVNISISDKEVESYESYVSEVVDNNTFTIVNEFARLSKNITIQRHDINCSFKFKLSEINWNLLTKKTVQNFQLIKLNQLVYSHRREQSKNIHTNEQDLVNAVKNQVLPQTQMPVQ